MRRATSVDECDPPAIPAQNPRRQELKRALSFKNVGKPNDPGPMREYDPSEKAELRRKRRSLYFDEQRAVTKLAHPQHFDFDALTIPESPTTTATRSQKSTRTGRTKKAFAKLKNILKG